MTQSFAFELVSPERLVLSEQVMQVVVPGTEGHFTVMAGHAPVMASVKTGVMEVTFEHDDGKNGNEKKLLVRGGFADVSPDGLTLLAEHVVDLADFDVDELTQKIKNAQEDMNDTTTEEEQRKAQLVLNRLEETKALISQTL